jgi:hypothetical protein
MTDLISKAKAILAPMIGVVIRCQPMGFIRFNGIGTLPLLQWALRPSTLIARSQNWNVWSKGNGPME